MTDDDRIAALFTQAAAETPPPPRFDHDSVVATSRRITARRRSAVLGGAMALLVVTGVSVAVGLPRPGGDAMSSAAAPAAPEAAAEAGAAADAVRAAPVPLGPGTTECAQRQDPQLRAVLEEVLPEVAGAVEAAVTTVCRPGGQRGVSLEVSDGAAAGLLTVEYLPPGESVGATSGPSAVAPTASGGTVVVGARGEGPGAPAPFADRLDATAADLAPRL